MRQGHGIHAYGVVFMLGARRVPDKPNHDTTATLSRQGVPRANLPHASSTCLPVADKRSWVSGCLRMQALDTGRLCAGLSVAAGMVCGVLTRFFQLRAKAAKSAVS